MKLWNFGSIFCAWNWRSIKRTLSFIDMNTQSPSTVICNRGKNASRQQDESSSSIDLIWNDVIEIETVYWDFIEFIVNKIEQRNSFIATMRNVMSVFAKTSNVHNNKRNSRAYLDYCVFDVKFLRNSINLSSSFELTTKTSRVV